jgi:hypothetical protein
MQVRRGPANKESCRGSELDGRWRSADAVSDKDRYVPRLPVDDSPIDRALCDGDHVTNSVAIVRPEFVVLIGA